MCKEVVNITPYEFLKSNGFDVEFTEDKIYLITANPYMPKRKWDIACIDEFDCNRHMKWTIDNCNLEKETNMYEFNNFRTTNVDVECTARGFKHANKGRINYKAYARPSVYMPVISRVIFNDPATIVFWEDGTKTVVKCQDGDIYDPEKGLAMAISKKALGNQGNYCEVFKKWLPEEVEEDSPTITEFMDAVRRVGKYFNLGEVDLSLSPTNKDEE